MGLDMYAHAVRPEHIFENKETGDIEFVQDVADKPEEIHYWRKHHDLHGWMENLYREKGGNADSFNCCKVQLNEDDLDDLEKAVVSNSLPKTSGFFFGDNPPDEESINDDLLFIAKARQAIKDGKLVFYDSWW